MFLCQFDHRIVIESSKDFDQNSGGQPVMTGTPQELRQYNYHRTPEFFNNFDQYYIGQSYCLTSQMTMEFLNNEARAHNCNSFLDFSQFTEVRFASFFSG